MLGSWLKQLGAGDEKADLTDDILVDISALAAPVQPINVAASSL